MFFFIKKVQSLHNKIYVYNIFMEQFIISTSRCYFLKNEIFLGVL